MQYQNFYDLDITELIGIYIAYYLTADTVILEFNQYSLGSRWRRAVVDRKHHREEGNESDGFYGGIRKLCDKNEISTWRRLWPTDMLK